MTDHFDLDATVEETTDGAVPAITSISLCTPGCLTSRYMCQGLTSAQACRMP